jgi:ketol-acid reductoisomerase
LENIMKNTQQDYQQHLSGKTVAVLGYGSQGRAQAKNLRDSGVEVVLGLRAERASWRQALSDGWLPVSFEEAVKQADLIAMLLPDMAQPQVYNQFVAPNIKPGATLLFAHGYCVHYGLIELKAEVNTVLVAPKSPGHLVREEYKKGRGVPCLYAVANDVSGDSESMALAYVQALGGLKAGVLKTSFKEETETDLFGEQAVLCGGTMELVKQGYETLVEAGYQPELAYFECLHELKLIVDLLYEGGFERMHHFVSDTANFGALVSGKRVVDEQVKSNMQAVLADIQNGEFAKQWLDSQQTETFKTLMIQSVEHPIEQVGSKLRRDMAWIN